MCVVPEWQRRILIMGVVSYFVYYHIIGNVAVDSNNYINRSLLLCVCITACINVTPIINQAVKKKLLTFLKQLLCLAA